MVVNTQLYGEFEYTEADIIVFDEGIPGFIDLKKYVLILNPEEELPFHWLQSIENEKVSFIVTSPFFFVETYDFEIPDSVVTKMEIENPEELAIYSIAVISDNVEESTLNLKAPIIINSTNRKAKQVILNEEYPYKYFLFQQNRG